jgi:hypothetical protein
MVGDSKQTFLSPKKPTQKGRFSAPQSSVALLKFVIEGKEKEPAALFRKSFRFEQSCTGVCIAASIVIRFT